MSLTIIDSDVLIDFSRGNQFAADWLQDAEANSTLALSSVTEMELMVGCLDKKNLRELKNFYIGFRFHILAKISRYERQN